MALDNRNIVSSLHQIWMSGQATGVGVCDRRSIRLLPEVLSGCEKPKAAQSRGLRVMQGFCGLAQNRNVTPTVGPCTLSCPLSMPARFTVPALVSLGASNEAV